MTITPFRPRPPEDPVDLRDLVFIAELGHLYRGERLSGKPDPDGHIEFYRKSFVEAVLTLWERHPEHATAEVLLARFGLTIPLYRALLSDPDLRSPSSPGHIP